MANEGNLKPLNKRTKSEQREIQKKGGQKSGEVRRAKKTFRQLAEAALALDIKDAKTKRSLQNMGIPEEDITQKTLCVFGILQKAQKGDVKAFEKLQELTGEKAAETNAEVLARLDRVIGEIDAEADR